MSHSKRQINLLFTIALHGVSTIFVRKVLHLYTAKIDSGNVIKKRFMAFLINKEERGKCMLSIVAVERRAN